MIEMDGLAFLSYVVILAFTPGPNNLMSLEESKRFGFRKSFPFMEGLLAGFLILAVAALIFTDWLLRSMPTVEPLLKAVGSAYILYLVWKLFASGATRSASESNRQLFLAGLILNLSNVKVMLYFLTGYSSFILPAYENFWIALLFGLLLCFAGACSNLLWACFGSLFKAFFARHELSINIVMAILLIYSAVEIWS
jgi:threonine/homoserine/homoserine lactone efflux protein